jgi:DDE superfamily endonuclease
MFQMPRSEGEWRAVAKDFMDKWQFPNCIGALDGKHVRVKAPPNTGSLYFNYKNYFSLVLLALVDASYRFLYVDVGGYGRTADGGIFANSSLSTALACNQLHVPPPEEVEMAGHIPYVVIADDAFPLKTYLMKPYAQRGLTGEQRIFNYRLSRARRVVENAFGILSQRFQIFGCDMALAPKKVEVVTVAACCLHNFLLRNSTSAASYTADIDQRQPSCNIQSVARQGSNRPSDTAAQVRNSLCRYFNSEHGAVSWQDQYDASH